MSARAKPKKPPQGVRLFPAVMATSAALLGLKAFTMAESLAQTATPAENPPAAAQHDTAAGGQPNQTPAQAGQSPSQCNPTIAQLAGLSQSEVEVLQALQARRQTLDQRATQVETQDDLMAAAQRRIDERIGELHQLETTVNGLLGQLDQAQEQRLGALVDVYQRMRAKDAANVFNGLDDTVMVQVASRMRQANLAEVMGHMQPDRARHLTQLLADRARPPTSGQQLLANATGAAAPAASSASVSSGPASNGPAGQAGH
jgi:flagellar motility protein MotE (MotC chaperone)